MPDGSRFRDDRWTPLRHAAELFLLSLRADPPEGRRPLRKEASDGHFSHIRFLVRWMAAENVRCFRDPDQDPVDRFVAMLRARAGRHASRLSLRPAEGYPGTIRPLPMHPDQLAVHPMMDPIPAGSVGTPHRK